MRGRKRQRKKFTKKNFIEIAPGLYVPRNPVISSRRSYMSLGAYAAIEAYCAGVRDAAWKAAGMDKVEEVLREQDRRA